MTIQIHTIGIAKKSIAVHTSTSVQYPRLTSGGGTIQFENAKVIDGLTRAKVEEAIRAIEIEQGVLYDE